MNPANQKLCREIAKAEYRGCEIRDTGEELYLVREESLR